MFRNNIFMGVAYALGNSLLRQTAEAAKFSTILFLILTQNVSYIKCDHNITANTVNDGYASWASTLQTGAIGSVPTLQAAAPDSHRLTKRMDLELCLGKFEIHTNTIIRTGESQTLGGKYLQGLELNTAEECQRLCCETELCDVYVFEDKTDGYCYLFECGPSENFHCKFTRHANYTSAVLTVLRHETEVTTVKPIIAHAASKSNISQQEWELSSLKVKPETQDKMLVPAVGTGEVQGATSGTSASTATVAIGTASNSIATAVPSTILGAEQKRPSNVAFPQKAYPAHCGRFQFTCHSGECIAVYNACDGIPQCEDGSDEGPECSGSTSTAKSNGEAALANSLDINSKKVASVPQYQPPLLQQMTQQQLQSVQQTHPQQLQQPQSVPQMFPAVIPPLINNREDVGAWANRKAVAAEADHVEETANDVELNSRIFSHKGGIQVPTTGVNANNIPNSALSNSYSNANGNNNNNIPNLNLNPVYNVATLQRNGIYVPQITDLSTNGGYEQQQQQQLRSPQVPQQQQQQPQYIVPQGHLMLPPNVQWQMQQQHVAPQQFQQQQTLSLPLQPGPPYIINTVGQQQEHQVPLPTSKVTTLDKTGQQQQQQIQLNDKQQISQQSPANVALAANEIGAAKPNTLPKATGQIKESKNILADKSIKDEAAAAGEYYEESDEEENSTEPPKKKHKHKKLAAIPKDEKKKAQLDPIELALEEQRQRAHAPLPIHEQYKMIHENLGLEFRDHDGQSERPGGAMLSLTLGLLVTAALAILIGCRMRTVGRRTRRMGAKAPYSHEADFLVNGMYLWDGWRLHSIKKLAQETYDRLSNIGYLDSVIISSQTKSQTQKTQQGSEYIPYVL